MPLTQTELEDLLLGSTGWRRFTQDSPIFADVWKAYLGRPNERRDLLLEPHHRAPAAMLAKAVRDRLPAVEDEHRLAYAGEYVAVALTLPELLGVVLPLSPWWQNLLGAGEHRVFAHLEAFVSGQPLDPDASAPPTEVPPPEDELKWFVTVAGCLLANRSPRRAPLKTLAGGLLDALGHPRDEALERPPLWSVNLNRPVRTTLWKSRETVKADAAGRVFPPTTEGLAWAVIDTGIDATHPAFRRRGKDLGKPTFDADTVVRATYDFTRLRGVIAGALAADATVSAETVTADVRDALDRGLSVDWRVYEPLIRVTHDQDYRVPGNAHGTHVAGTIAGDWRTTDEGKPRHPLQGICPGLDLYDLRVLDDDGTGDEFSILAALAFVRWRNAQSGGTVIHGVNLSLALDHDVLNSACGRSPVCLEVERVDGAGVVVVAAAGNEGRTDYVHQGIPSEGYRTVSITDPGNAEVAITVGSTHRSEPHAYGVSYFSSRGPTGDGRSKPDLVAPGEKITAPIPGTDSARMDGTSMAAPHVSGAAALLMARHRELVGRPARVKEVLCNAATDLGRERHYQGHGLLDILRALQSV